MNDHEQNGGARDDYIEYMAEQVCDLVCSLDSEQLTSVFARARRKVLEAQQVTDASRRDELGRLHGLMEQ